MHVHPQRLKHMRQLATTNPSAEHLGELVNALEQDLAAVTTERDALTYPVQLHTHPLLTVESGGIRYVLEAMSDEDGEWFEVKSATPTEAMTLVDFAPAAVEHERVTVAARQALAAYRAAQREDDEVSRAY